MTKTPDVFGGRFYERDGRGRMREVPPHDVSSREPDAWICRRVADFPHGVAPEGAGLAHCGRCGAEIAFNPGRILTVPVDTPQICMQCAHVEPLPIEKPS